MANPDQTARAALGADAWNRWRQANRDAPVDLRGADLNGMDLGGIDLRDADLRSIDLHGADLSSAKLDGADLTQATLIEADLHRVSLRRANLNRADLVWANLTAADLRESNLSGANLTEATLLDASLVSASLVGANVSAADLTRADLARTNLSRADLSRLRLDRTSVDGARIGWAVLGDIDVTRLRGLDTVEIIGPLTIGIDMILRSRGAIPAEFLVAAGVPETVAALTSAVAAGAPPLLTNFIAASRHDLEIVSRLCTDLRARGVRAWVYPEGANLGESIWHETDMSVRLYDRLVLACSQRSLRSASILTEVERTMRREERSCRQELLSVVLDDFLDDGWQHDLRTEIRGRVVADLRHLNQDRSGYASAVDHLAQALLTRTEDESLGRS